MLSFLRIAFMVLLLTLAGCSAQQTRPIEPVSLYGVQFRQSGLTHVDDRRSEESKQTKGDGVDYIHYGDDKLSPGPVEILDQEIGEYFGENLNGNKVVVSKYTISLLPIVREDNLAYSIAGPSLFTALLAGPPGGPTGESKYECDIKGSYKGRTWWVKNHVVVSQKGAQADMEELLRTCNSVAVSRLGDVIKSIQGSDPGSP